MEQVFYNLENTLTSLISKKEVVKNKETEPFNREHIFYDLLDYLSEKNIDSRLQLYYYFQQYQECLTFCQADMLNMAEHKLEYIDKNLAFNMSDEENASLRALFFPMKAYYSYVKEDYVEALSLLNKSLSELLFLSKKNISEAKSAYNEQLLNICKVYFRNSEVDLAVEQSKLLFKHLLHDLNISIDEKKISFNEAKDTLSYYVDSIITSVFNLGVGNQFNIIESVFDEKALKLAEGTDIKQELEQQVLIIRIILADNNNNVVLSKLKSHLPSLKNYSEILQAIILGQIAVLSTKMEVGSFNKATFCEFISKYVVETLKVDELLFKKIINYIYELESKKIINV